MSTPITVLVVDDDPAIAAGHAQYVTRVPGFAVAGVAHSGGVALAMLERAPADLVLLDFYMPDMSGLDVCRAIRSSRHLVDVMAVTSARDLAVVRTLVAQGVVQYLLKPFTAAAFRERLERYAEYRRQVARSGTAADQGEVDRALATLRGAGDAAAPPKGMSAETLGAVVAMLDRARDARSAHDVGDELGVSRVTARRYLEYLTQEGLVRRAPRYGGAGRPEHLYRLRTG
ncbi:response regulator [Pseudonocardia nigra]|uniref:response regulator n=1 Tax=Pseudonocardia nigra TaxID=1921578 RepID=UPI001C5F70AF|nr:response regulator [Pseudonocardia nigra]